MVSNSTSSGGTDALCSNDAACTVLGVSISAVAGQCEAVAARSRRHHRSHLTQGTLPNLALACRRRAAFLYASGLCVQRAALMGEADGSCSPDLSLAVLLVFADGSRCWMLCSTRGRGRRHLPLRLHAAMLPSVCALLRIPLFRRPDLNEEPPIVAGATT
eukprot:COSAG02_NODE_1512_length_12212_cov_4.145133_2_plen_160_part_00